MKQFRDDADLHSVLKNASKDDLTILIDMITNSGKGRISLGDDVNAQLIEAKKSKKIDDAVRAKIAEEIQAFGGNTLINLIRGGKGIPYLDIACDVADHLRANYITTHRDVLSVEGAILMKVVEKSLEKMSEEEKRKFFDKFGVRYTGAGPAAVAALQVPIAAGGFASYQLALIAANGVARAIVGRGLSLGANAGLARGIGVFAGPIGWAITAIWTAFDLASPAYRVTVPSVIQIAYMRQKMTVRVCPKCSAPIGKTAKFCTECGKKMKPE